MAHPLVVAGATAEHFGALMGPGVDHGARPYSRTAGLVKRTVAKRASSVCRAVGVIRQVIDRPVRNYRASGAFVIKGRELVRTGRVAVQTKRGGTNKIVFSFVRYAIFD